MSLIKKIKELPDKIGVYKYIDNSGKVLYIGKAKNLKKRVKSYWRFKPELSPNPNLNIRTIKMLLEVKDIEYILSASENDALIEEQRLIKTLKPKYNILLRDDKSYPYIMLDTSKPFPRFELAREKSINKSILYYGAFPKGARAILDSIYELFPLVQRANCLREKRACIFYQINRCLAPCENRVSQEEYFKILNQAKETLENIDILVEKLKSRMNKLAFEERFEEAIIIRDRIEQISNLKIESRFELEEIKELFRLKNLPNRVEAFDNSHLMGEGSVGAMVVFEDGVFQKSKYRRYALKNKSEYYQMKELLKRRLKRLDKISPPNLWIIDGGETLLNLAYELSFEYQLDIDIIAISKEKREDRVNRSKGSTADIIYTKYKTFQLLPTDKRLQWVQKIRDEAHRFALGYHREKKRKEDIKISLLQKKGIGVATLKKLLNYFGTFEAIKSASFEEISVISSKKVAKILKTENVKK